MPYVRLFILIKQNTNHVPPLANKTSSDIVRNHFLLLNLQGMQHEKSKPTAYHFLF